MSWGGYNGEEGGGGRMSKQKKYKGYKSKETIRDILLLESCNWAERNLKKETLELFGVKCKISKEFGPTTILKVYFPYYSQEGKLCGYKVKDLSKDKHEKGHFYTIGHVGVDCQLFGQRECKGHKTNLKYVEGETCFLSAYQALLDRQLSDETPEQYRSLKPQIVSPGCGTVHAVEHISNNSKFINQYKNHILSFDNDFLTDIELGKKNPGMKGRECTQAVGAYLVGGSKNIYVTTWPEYFNDCSDVLQKGKSGELARILLFDKEPFSYEKIISVGDIEIEELLKPKEKGIYIDSFPILMEKLWGIRKREYTIMTAMSGVGKTVCCSEFAYGLAEKSKEPIALAFLEETSKETLLRMIARKLKINYYKFVFNPLKYCTKKQFTNAYEWTKDKFYFLDVFGSMKIPELMDSFKNFVYVNNCAYIVFDHISMLASGSQVNDERRLIDNMMTEQAAFTAQTDVGVIAVSHLGRQAQLEIGKLSDLKEPKWINVRKEHLKGSSSLEQLPWNIIGLDMLLEPNRERSDVRFTVLKNRSIGLLGVADQFFQDSESGLITLKDKVKEGY